MRPLLAGLTLAVALLVGSLPLRADDLTDDLLVSQFGEYLESLRVQAGIPGLAAAIVGDSDILWEQGFGQQDVENAVATLPDTPFHLDAVTQIVTAAMALRCVEEGKLSLDDHVSQYVPDSPDADATLRQILTHTSGPPDDLVFAYRPERLAPLGPAIAACRQRTFRSAVAAQLDQLAMVDSVPGPDAALYAPPADNTNGTNPPEFTLDMVARYGDVLKRLATPYAVNKDGGRSLSEYTATTLTPASGLISTVRDLARFDVALRKGVLLQPDTLAAAWQAPVDRNGRPLPHGLGWFVQTYNNETIVWQFGVEDNAASSLVLSVPARSLTLILLANSDGLAKSFDLANGDVTTSPFAGVFLGLFAR
ncbi:MAG: serine hydrolase domain-containing protein [Betaproteobacteria bacterium]